MASFLTGIASLFGSSFFQEAVNQMPAIVATVYQDVKDLINPAPTSPAEVAVAAMFKKAIPSGTADVLAKVKNIYGEAVAEYLTQNKGADMNTAATQSGIQALANAGVTAYAKKNGLDLSAITGGPTVLTAQLLTSAILVNQAGMGVAAIDVTKGA